ncbi:MAG: RNA polymerase sigma factor [Bacteroidota bacterium]
MSDRFSDNHLMQQVKAGEVDQLGLLYERYHRVLFGFFYNQTGNREQSEDLVQGVFMRVLKYRERFREEGEFKHWMFAIARNLKYDQYKQQQKFVSEPIEPHQDRITGSLAPQQAMEQQEELNLLRRALQGIEASKREILVMSKLEGMAYKDIAEVLGCSEGTVKVRVFRALKSLKQAYSVLTD